MMNLYPNKYGGQVALYHLGLELLVLPRQLLLGCIIQPRAKVFSSSSPTGSFKENAHSKLLTMVF
jgi:hypothetical protein